MSDRLGRLESLLERVRANVLRPRAATAAVDVVAEPPETLAEAPDESFTPFSVTGEVSRLELVESEPPDELTESDLVEMSPELLQSLTPPATGGWPSEPPEADEPPISSQRPRLTSDLEADLQASTDADEREEPLMTPPPESGPQEAPLGGLYAPAVPEVDNLLAEAPPMSQGADHGPTPEQIGESVELEERGGPALELDTAQAHLDAVTLPPKEDLEALLNPPPSVGIYDESLLPPPEARAELFAHARKFPPPGTAGAEPGGPSLISEEPAVENDELIFESEGPVIQSGEPVFRSEAPAFPGETVPFPGEAAPEVFKPALAAGGAPELRLPTAGFRPQTFIELLDASIALRG